MVELILTVCLLAQPGVCKDQRIPFQQAMGITRCMHEGQLQAARWLSTHPDWELKRWRCGPPEA